MIRINIFLFISLIGLINLGCNVTVNTDAPQNISTVIQPCLPPCWQDIIPGVTTESEFLKKIEKWEQTGFINDSEKVNIGNYNLTLRPNDTVRIRFYENDHVFGIHGILWESPFTVSDLMESLGEPKEYYSSEIHPTSFTTCADWEQDRAYPIPKGPSGFLIYPEEGAIFRIRKAQLWPDLICPDVLVTQFYYFEPEKFEEILVDDEISLGFYYEPSSRKPYVGYGNGY